MKDIKAETIEAFNDFMAKQKREEAEQAFFMIQFSSEVEKGYAGPIAQVELLSEANFKPSGKTKLLDAIGKSIAVAEAMIALMRESPDTVIIVVLTDGDENNSEEYSFRQIVQMVSQKREVGWKFIFIGPKAEKTAASLGMDAELSVPFEEGDDIKEAMNTTTHLTGRLTRDL
jgi:hypothetical protein